MSDALRGLEQLGRAGNVGIARALRRSANSARADLVEKVARDTGLRQSDVRNEIRTSINVDTFTARIETAGFRIPLIQFRATGPEPSRGKGRGVSATMLGQRKRYPHAFIATVRGALPSGVTSSGHRGVFERKGKERLPIKQLFGPSIPHVFAKYLPGAAERAVESLAKNIEHEFQFALSKE